MSGTHGAKKQNGDASLSCAKEWLLKNWDDRVDARDREMQVGDGRMGRVWSNDSKEHHKNPSFLKALRDAKATLAAEAMHGTD